MEKGVYHWPDSNNAIELQYDWAAVQWLLENVRGNLVLAESAQLDYYRAGGTRVASLTGLSGLLGMHAGEQRYREDVGERHGQLSEFWNTVDLARMESLIEELEIGLIYAGQLERHQHPGADSRLAGAGSVRAAGVGLPESRGYDLRGFLSHSGPARGPIGGGCAN